MAAVLCIPCALQVGNAETEGYSMVTGIGATMVLNLAVSALFKEDAGQLLARLPQQSGCVHSGPLLHGVL